MDGRGWWVDEGQNQMIVLDTETTGLPEPELVPLDQQPHIIEFGAIKLNDDTLEQVDQMHFMVNPGIPIPPIITKITGITDADVHGKKKFASAVLPLSEFFLG